MDIAIVTGAETPLGIRLIQRLIQLGCRVHGIGNNFAQVNFADKNFIAHAIDVSDLEVLTQTVSDILAKEGRLHILIHAIDVTPGASFENLPVGNLEAILKIGLLGPVMLTRLALPNLLRFRGKLINIIPANKSGHTASAANALIEGGLREMNNALFDRARDAGLRVTNLILKQNPTADSGASAEKLIQTRIDPETVARCVEQLLDENDPNVPNEITLYPRISACAEAALPETGLAIDPYDSVVLPPVGYAPPKQAKIPTRERDRIERTIPYTDEEMEEKIAAAIEDFETHPERFDSPPKKKNNNKQRPTKNSQVKFEANSDSNEPNEVGAKDEPAKKKRSRRRGGRNRNRERNHTANTEEKSTTVLAKDEADKTTNELSNSPDQLNAKPTKVLKAALHPNASQADKKIKIPPLAAEQIEKTTSKPEPVKNKAPDAVTASSKASLEKKLTSKRVTKKAVTKKAVKKAVAKKAVKKAAVKKAAVKKAVSKTAKKKVAVTKTAVKKAVKKVASKKAVRKPAKHKIIKPAQ